MCYKSGQFSLLTTRYKISLDKQKQPPYSLTLRKQWLIKASVCGAELH
jgi:hypothetical protein